MSEMLAALVGAVVAYVGGWAQQALRLRRERKALASILLQEVRTLDMSMRQIYDRRQRGRLPDNPFPIIQGGRDTFRVFRTDTVVRLLEVGGLLDNLTDIQDSVQGGALDPGGSNGAQVVGTVQVIVLRIPKLKEALEKEGGQQPDWTPAYVAVNLSDFKALPPSPFEPMRDG